MRECVLHAFFSLSLFLLIEMNIHTFCSSYSVCMYVCISHEDAFFPFFPSSDSLSFPLLVIIIIVAITTSIVSMYLYYFLLLLSAWDTE